MGEPSWNFTSCRSLKVKVSPSALEDQDEATSGSMRMSFQSPVYLSSVE